MGERYFVTIEVEVNDPIALQQAAMVQADKEGLTSADWSETRSHHVDPITADLIMVLDITPAGCEILQTEVA